MRKFAVIGSGPAGFYTAQKLLKLPNVAVTMFEKHMVPYGLVRFGVAPDHPEVKNAITKFEKIAEHEHFQFVGNCKVGQDIGIAEIQKCFDGVVLASGSQSDRPLGIEHEFDTKNVFSAREFVGWYNGDPDMNHISPKLSNIDTAVIIGNGNVALDCARILLSPVTSLSVTDITSKAQTELISSQIKNIYIVGRRGVLQASFTSKELREMMSLPEVQYEGDDSIISTISSSQNILAKNRQLKRLCDILLKGSKFKNVEKTWHLKFLRSPIEIERNGNNIKSIIFRHNVLKEVDGSTKLIGTELKERIECGLLIKSIGYLNTPYYGIPFDSRSCIIPNKRGRVLDTNGNHIHGLYTAGWLKTGPVGVLTSTLFDANETACSIEEDIPNFEKLPEKPGILGLNVSDTITFNDWRKINAEEIRLGAKKGKPREKITDTSLIKTLIS